MNDYNDYLQLFQYVIATFLPFFVTTICGYITYLMTPYLHYYYSLSITYIFQTKTYTIEGITNYQKLQDYIIINTNSVNNYKCGNVIIEVPRNKLMPVILERITSNKKNFVIKYLHQFIHKLYFTYFIQLSLDIISFEDYIRKRNEQRIKEEFYFRITTTEYIYETFLQPLFTIQENDNPDFLENMTSKVLFGVKLKLSKPLDKNLRGGTYIDYPLRIQPTNEQINVVQQIHRNYLKNTTKSLVVYLYGLPGSGKSTIGYILSALYSHRYLKDNTYYSTRIIKYDPFDTEIDRFLYLTNNYYDQASETATHLLHENNITKINYQRKLLHNDNFEYLGLTSDEDKILPKREPIILVTNEFETLFSSPNNQEESTTQPITNNPDDSSVINNKNSLQDKKKKWNDLLDEIDLGFYPNTIWILTSNLSPEQFSSKYDASLIRKNRVHLTFEMQNSVINKPE